VRNGRPIYPNNCPENLVGILTFSEKFLGKVWWIYTFFAILAKHVLTRCRTKTMIFSGIQANRADSKNWILFQFKTAWDIIFGRNFACIFTSKDNTTRKFEFCNGFPITFQAVEIFQLYGYFQLAGILSFQKRYTCPKKILEILELFKKMWPQIPLFSANFNFGANFCNENFQIANPNFSHVIYN
jgi:hypothetical protein